MTSLLCLQENPARSIYDHKEKTQVIVCTQHADAYMKTFNYMPISTAIEWNADTPEKVTQAMRESARLTDNEATRAFHDEVFFGYVFFCC